MSTLTATDVKALVGAKPVSPLETIVTNAFESGMVKGTDYGMDIAVLYVIKLAMEASGTSDEGLEYLSTLNLEHGSKIADFKQDAMAWFKSAGKH